MHPILMKSQPSVLDTKYGWFPEFHLISIIASPQKEGLNPISLLCYMFWVNSETNKPIFMVFET